MLKVGTWVVWIMVKSFMWEMPAPMAALSPAVPNSIREPKYFCSSAAFPSSSSCFTMAEVLGFCRHKIQMVQERADWFSCNTIELLNRADFLSRPLYWVISVSKHHIPLQEHHNSCYISLTLSQYNLKYALFLFTSLGAALTAVCVYRYVSHLGKRKDFPRCLF